jgi:hypothetical protein
MYNNQSVVEVYAGFSQDNGFKYEFSGIVALKPSLYAANRVFRLEWLNHRRRNDIRDVIFSITKSVILVLMATSQDLDLIQKAFLKHENW